MKSNVATKKVNFDKLAQEYGLNELQQKFAEYFVYVTGLDGPTAVELAGYSVVNDNYDYKTEELKDYYKYIQKKRIARDLLGNSKVLQYITALRDDLNNQLIVDKLWVIDNLKRIVTTGSEQGQIKALELIGKTMEMFVDKSKTFEGVEDPAKIAKEAFEKRQQNVVEFEKKQQNE